MPGSRRLSGLVTHREFYAWVREYLRAVRAGNPERVRRVLRKHRSLLEEEETLLAPIYFHKPDVAQVVLQEVLRMLERRRFYHRWLYGLIHWFGEARTKELERDVLGFLRHRRSDMRYIALSVLTLHWKMVKHRRKYEELLKNDPAVDVRCLAAGGLAYVLGASRDRRATRMFARMVRDVSEKFEIRREAYDSLRVIWIPWQRRRLESAEYYRKWYDKVTKDPKAWEQWVDWDFVAAVERGERPRRTSAASDRRHRTDSYRSLETR